MMGTEKRYCTHMHCGDKGSGLKKDGPLSIGAVHA